MKKHVTKRQKKEKANRKAKREQRRVAEEQLPPEPVKPDAPSMSPARRAFQDE